jgi:uncharacterized membrane protein (DUF106 family)
VIKTVASRRPSFYSTSRHLPSLSFKTLSITILVVCIIFALIWWILTQIPLPAPFAQIVRVVVVVIFCIWLIYELLPMAGGLSHPLIR